MTVNSRELMTKFLDNQMAKVRRLLTKSCRGL